MIDHVSLEVSDLEQSARFYDAVFFAVGVRRMTASDAAIAYGIDHGTFRIRRRGGPVPVAAGHVAIAARGKAAVDAAHEAGVAAGGSDDGAPGPRPGYGPRYYAGYLRDPDGSRIELVTGSR
jgi:catechol 2,3-dioxygenase-like lactoylglutathione lyase family enzyme